jgi:hypothetical protein
MFKPEPLSDAALMAVAGHEDKDIQLRIVHALLDLSGCLQGFKVALPP